MFAIEAIFQFYPIQPKMFVGISSPVYEEKRSIEKAKANRSYSTMSLYIRQSRFNLHSHRNAIINTTNEDTLLRA